MRRNSWAATVLSVDATATAALTVPLLPFCRRRAVPLACRRLLQLADSPR